LATQVLEKWWIPTTKKRERTGNPHESVVKEGKKKGRTKKEEMLFH